MRNMKQEVNLPEKGMRNSQDRSGTFCALPHATGTGLWFYVFGNILSYCAIDGDGRHLIRTW